MAEEKKVTTTQEKAAAKKAAEGKAQKILNWFTKLPSRIATPFKNMWYELKKVTWPSKKDLINYSIIVIGFVVVLALVVGVLDTASSFVVKKLIEL